MESVQTMRQHPQFMKMLKSKIISIDNITVPLLDATYATNHLVGLAIHRRSVRHQYAHKNVQTLPIAPDTPLRIRRA